MSQVRPVWGGEQRDVHRGAPGAQAARGEVHPAPLLLPGDEALHLSLFPFIGCYFVCGLLIHSLLDYVTLFLICC